MGNFAENLNLDNRFRPPLDYSSLEAVDTINYSKKLIYKKIQCTKE